MVLDLFMGGDLRFHLLETGTFTSKQIVFYAAEIGSALFYLHDKNIVHRDIKPDNCNVFSILKRKCCYLLMDMLV